MNMIVCGSDCRYQKDGYCSLEGRAVITNAVSSPCCYYEKNDNKRRYHGDDDKGTDREIS